MKSLLNKLSCIFRDLKRAIPYLTIITYLCIKAGCTYIQEIDHCVQSISLIFMTHNREKYAPSEEKRPNNANYDALKRLVAQVKRMSIRIKALEDKVPKMQVELKRNKDSVSVEDTFEAEDDLIEWVGIKKEARLQRNGVASHFK